MIPHLAEDPCRSYIFQDPPRSTLIPICYLVSPASAPNKNKTFQESLRDETLSSHPAYGSLRELLGYLPHFCAAHGLFRLTCLYKAELY